MTNRIKYHIHINNKVMITNIKSLVLVLATTTTVLMTSLGATNVFGQMPALEDKPKAASPVGDNVPPIEPPATEEKEQEEPNTSFGKVTIPVSSGEQIIIEVPMKDGNSYKLVPIK